MADTAWRSRIVGHTEEPPEALVSNPRNWRKHPRPQLDALSGVLSEVGWVQSVVKNVRSGHVVDGHARVALALARREPAVPVVLVDLSPEEEATVLATLDPIGAMATADTERLDALLREVRTDDAALRGVLRDLADEHGLAFEEDAPPEAPEPEVDRAEELRAKWGTAPGQLWEIGRHRLLCGDATKAEDVERLMAGERAALMATDPPYMVGYEGGFHPRSLSNSELTKDKHHGDYQEQEAAPGFLTDFLRLALAHALVPNPALYQWHAHRRQALIEAAWADTSLLVHAQIIWVKARAVLTHSHYMWQHEPCFYGWPQGHQPARRPPNNATTVWSVNQAGYEGTHPTEKPLELFARPIEYHTEAGGLCYEPFFGSGSQLVAAEQLGRRCYGLEIAPAFVAVTLERLSKMGLAPRLLET